MTAVTLVLSFAGLYLALAGGVIWKIGRSVFLADPIRELPCGRWLIGQPDQACLVGVILLMTAASAVIVLRK